MKKVIHREIDLLPEFQHFIIASRKGKRIKKDGTKITDGSVNKLESTYQLLKSFSIKKNFYLRIKLLNRNTREIKAEKNYWKRFYKKFTDYMFDDLNCFDNYAGSVIKDIRSFFNYLLKEQNQYIGNFHQQFYVHKEDIQIITLQPEQLEILIHSNTFEGYKGNILQKVKDIFVIGCTVALRYSDLMSLKKNKSPGI